MRSLLLLSLLVALHPAGMSAWAAEPTTRPAVTRVLILPFEPIGPAGEAGWVGPAIQQSLLAELSRMPGMAPAASPQPVSAQSPQAGPAASVRFVVFGSYQIVELDLRITGQVLDARESRVIGGLKATGTVRDLFAIEDTLGTQVRRALAQAMTPAATSATPASGAQPVASRFGTALEPQPVQLGIGVYAGEVPEWAPFSPPPPSGQAYDRYRFGPYSFPYLGWCGYPYLGYGAGYNFPGVYYGAYDP